MILNSTSSCSVQAWLKPRRYSFYRLGNLVQRCRAIYDKTVCQCCAVNIALVIHHLTLCMNSLNFAFIGSNHVLLDWEYQLLRTRLEPSVMELELLLFVAVLSVISRDHNLPDSYFYLHLSVSLSIIIVKLL